MASSTTREKQDCVKLDTDGKWDDIGCGKPLNYACQKPTALIPTSTTASSTHHSNTVDTSILNTTIHTNNMATTSAFIHKNTTTPSETTSNTTNTVAVSTAASTTCATGWSISGGLCYKHHSETGSYNYVQVNWHSFLNTQY